MWTDAYDCRMPPTDSIAELKGAVEAAARALRDGEPTEPAPTLDRPPKPDLGDYSSNAAMLLAGPLGDNPRAVAERLRGELEGALGGEAGELDRVEVAGPGFVNLFLSDAWYRRALAGLLAAGDDLGPGPTASPERILVEFVSANPTGPLHVGGGRGAAYGDAVSRLLEAIGHEVGREYYINDAGSQVTNFARSIAARMRGEEPPEDGYQGEYVIELGRQIAGEGIDAGDLEAVGARGIELMIAQVRETLSRFGVEMDVWFSERSLVERGDAESALAKLDAGGHTYRSDDALWLRTTTFGDDKDRVLIRSDGEPTYLMPDIAYHWDKLERGYERLIDVLGADHHGYIGRLRASIEALGADPDSFEALIMSLVHIVEDGQRAQMSKRSGDFVSLDDLIDDIGVDAVRWFMLWRSHETTVDIDLALARKQASDNPVYYVQYAHARIASILRKATDEGGTVPDVARPRGARRAARGEREGAGQAAAGVPQRGARVGGAAGAAPDLRLLDRGRGRFPRLLPGLPGGRGRGGGGGNLAAGALPGGEADDRGGARAAGDLGARADVTPAS